MFIEHMRLAMKGHSVTFTEHLGQGVTTIRSEMHRPVIVFEMTMKRNIAEIDRPLTEKLVNIFDAELWRKMVDEDEATTKTCATLQMCMNNRSWYSWMKKCRWGMREKKYSCGFIACGWLDHVVLTGCHRRGAVAV